MDCHLWRFSLGKHCGSQITIDLDIVKFCFYLKCLLLLFIQFNLCDATFILCISFLSSSCVKGELGDFFLFVQSFYRPKTKTSFNRQFSPKRPKLVKNQAKGSKIHQIRTKWHPTYCGNPSILSSDLLWESTNSVLRATVGIHSSI